MRAESCLKKYAAGSIFAVFLFLCCYQTAFSQEGGTGEIIDDQESETGLASWYGPGLDQNITARGEVFDMHELTAAHPTLPFDTRVRVTNLKNKKSVIVRINDRGPFIQNRIIDLSREAARQLEMLRTGVATVKVEVVE